MRPGGGLLVSGTPEKSGALLPNGAHMSNRASLANLVQTKIQAARKRIDDETSKISDPLVQAQTKSQMLGDYQLFFQGAREALAAIGISDEDVRAVALVEKAIQSDIDAEQNRIALEEELRGEA